MMKNNSLGNLPDSFTDRRSFSQWWNNHGGLNGVGHIAFNGFRIVFIILLVFSVTYALSDSSLFDKIGFQWLMSVLQNAPSLSMDWIYYTLPILSDGSTLDIFRSWLNTFLGIIRPILLVFQGLAQLLTYISYFIGVLFGFVGG